MPNPTNEQPTVQTPASNPELLELTSFANFISQKNYNKVDNYTAQAMIDWIRNEKLIYVNGLQFKKILDEYRVKNFEAELNKFLSADPESKEREQVLKETILMVLKQNGQEITEDQIDLNKLSANTWFYNFFDDVRKDGFDFDKRFGANEGPVGERKYQENESPTFGALKTTIHEAGFYLSANYRSEANIQMIAEIWKKYVFNKINSPEEKEELTKMFFNYAHQGGFMHSLITAHIAHVIGLQNGFTALGKESMEQTRIDIKVHGQEIDIVEKSPLITLYNTMDIETAAFDSKMADMEIRHNISLVNGEAKLKIVAVRDFVYDLQTEHPETGEQISAVELILGNELLENARKESKKYKMLGELMSYANNYVQHGHDSTLIKTLLGRYKEFDLSSVETVKGVSALQRKIQPGQEKHHQGDQILAALGKADPEYAIDLANNIRSQTLQANGKDSFVKTLKLLVRLGRADLAESIILEAVRSHPDSSPEYAKIIKEFEDVTDKTKASYFRRGYEVLLKNGFIKPVMTEDLKEYAQKFIVEGHNAVKVASLVQKHKTLSPSFFAHSGIEHSENLIFKQLGKRDHAFFNEVSSNLKKYAQMGEMPYVRALQVMIKMGEKSFVRDSILGQVDAVNKKLSNELRNDKDLMTESGLKKAYSALRECGFLPPPIPPRKAMKSN
jgi:hypothetical protein